MVVRPKVRVMDGSMVGTAPPSSWVMKTMTMKNHMGVERIDLLSLVDMCYCPNWSVSSLSMRSGSVWVPTRK